MLKSLGILTGGVFIGAVGAEIVHKKYPQTVEKLKSKFCLIISEAKDAFRNGYQNATGPKPASA
ncbi:MAG TPA: hypothetical protein HPP87_03115 [Planctomycetes bacterium]|nr:hypothetical protein [Planctomycetota bacterium]HIJ70336.1 hypothetical protein [Planctomycetota bacterium]